MKKVILTIVAVLLVSLSVKAQPYNWAVGLRGGLTWGDVTVKHFTGSSTAIEVNGAISFNGFGWELAGMYEWHNALAGALNVYYGPGAHIGTFNDGNGQALALGILGTVGLEYKFGIPIALSLDWRPHMTYQFGTAAPGLRFGWGDVGLGIKFCF